MNPIERTELVRKLRQAHAAELRAANESSFFDLRTFQKHIRRAERCARQIQKLVRG